jgi:dinuclear metal center YbgI/SA1388 family protein
VLQSFFPAPHAFLGFAVADFPVTDFYFPNFLTTPGTSKNKKWLFPTTPGSVRRKKWMSENKVPVFLAAPGRPGKNKWSFLTTPGSTENKKRYFLTAPGSTRKKNRSSLNKFLYFLTPSGSLITFAAMTIGAIIQTLEAVAPPAYQESYDNAGLLTGDAQSECTGVLCSLDVTEAVIAEASEKGCNLVVVHHPIIFGGLKKLTGSNYVEKTVIAAIRLQVAIYAIHTNLDNMLTGVNDRMADRLGLVNRRVLVPKTGQLLKLFTFVPLAQAEEVRQALFSAGAGQIGRYSNCSFSGAGEGSFKGAADTQPFAGQPGELHIEKEIKIEVIFPAVLKKGVINALLKAHPYEEVAYDLIQLANDYQQVGSGLLAELPAPVSEPVFLQQLKAAFGLQLVRHTPLLGKPVQKIALCGGAGSFLTGKALAAGADVFVTADVKYHEFFDANDRLVLADIGHWESEQFTIDLLYDILLAKFPTFALLKSKVKTNPVSYFI